MLSSIPEFKENNGGTRDQMTMVDLQQKIFILAMVAIALQVAHALQITGQNSWDYHPCQTSIVIM